MGYYSDTGEATGEPLLSTEQARQAAQGPPPEPVLPANWGTKSQALGDGWLDGDDKQKKPVNKARGALFTDLLVSDEMIADHLMDEGNE